MRRSRPTFCIPKAAGLRAADCGHSFTSRIGAGLGGLDRTVGLNSKSLALVLCTRYRRFKEDALAMRPRQVPSAVRLVMRAADGVVRYIGAAEGGRANVMTRREISLAIRAKWW